MEPGPDGLYAAVPFSLPKPHLGTVTCAAPVHSTRMQSGLLKCGTDVTTSAILIGNALVAEVPEGSGTGEFVFDEIVRGHIAWKDAPEGGARPCTITSIDGWATGIHGRVVGDVVPNSDVRGCRSYATIEDGEFFMTVFAPTDCTLRVESWEPERKGEGAAVAVHLEVGRDLEVTLHYPTGDELRPYTEEEIAGIAAMDERIEAIKADAERQNEPR